MQLDKTRLICELLNMFGTVEGDENVKRDQTIEFVTIFNMCDCWMKLDWEWIRQVNLWNFWTIEYVTVLNKCEWECKTRSDYWICETVWIRDQTIEFVTLLKICENVNDYWIWDMCVKN